MDDLLGLAGIVADGAPTETPDRIGIPAILAFEEAPACPSCGEPMTKNGVEHVSVMDAPSRGKRVRILLRKERRRCRGCKQQQTADSPDLRTGYRVLTRRLVRYVENQVVKTTISAVARDTGLTADIVTDLALDLDQRLQALPSHWETPAAIAIDNIETAKGFRYQVLLDQLTNRPMGIASTWGFEPIRRVLANYIDVERVRVFSTDMSDVNLSLARVLTNAIHVADKFHVYQMCNLSIAAVIRQRSAIAEGEGDTGGVRALKAAKPHLLGKPQPRASRTDQLGLDLAPLPPNLARYADVAAAHRVRVGLVRFYASTGLFEAREALDDLYRCMSDGLVAAAMKPALDYVRGHDEQVFAYFEALDLMGRDLWSPTTNGLERRNGTLQEIWRSARAYRNLPLFRLRAVYHPYTFGLHILDCATCGGFVGPLGVAETLARSQGSDALHVQCRQCLPSATPDAAESITSSSEYGVATG